MLKLDISHVDASTLESYQNEISQIHQTILNKTAQGSDYLGWLSWPSDYDQTEFALIKKLAKQINDKADTLVVCGIGGSYLGSRAAIEMITGIYPKRKVEIIYLGNTFSSTYIVQTLERIKDRSVVVNVISKSGTTTETAMAFRILKQFMEEKYGKDEARQRIIATTDRHKGTLKTLADKEAYITLGIPDDIGGRYSVLTAVGLLPIAVAGIDIDAMMQGAKDANQSYQNDQLSKNDAYTYAVTRRILAKQGKSVELLVSYETQLAMLAEWWKQLFGESEGKQGLGIFPASVNFTTDLHSMGQFVQEGNPCLFETILMIEKPMLNMTFPKDDSDLDGMNYLSGKTFDEVNKAAALGTMIAHHDEGGVPVIKITVPDFSAYSFGYLAQFFFIACGMSVHLLHVNPFNQPGVEVYKKNMFKILGKK